MKAIFIVTLVTTENRTLIAINKSVTTLLTSVIYLDLLMHQQQQQQQQQQQ